MTHKTLYLLSLIGLLLTSCSDPHKPRLPGNRLSVLESEVMLRVDIDPSAIEVTLPPAEVINAWPQNGFHPTHKVPHARQNLQGKVQWQESIGRGNSSTRAITSPPISDGQFIYTMDAYNKIECRALDDGKLLWHKNTLLDGDDENVKSKSKTKGYTGKNHVGSHGEVIGGGLALDIEGKSLYASYPDGVIAKAAAKDGDLGWYIRLPDLIRSSPLVNQNTVYVLTSNNKIYAIDKEPGRILWTYSAREEAVSFAGSPVPAVYQSTVIAPFSSGELCSLHPANGLEFWRDSAMSYRTIDSKSIICQFLSNPVIDRDLIIAVSHGDLTTAIDLSTGQRVWQKPMGGTQTPFVTESFVYMITSSNDLVCLTRSSGKIVWVHALKMFKDEKKKKDRIQWYGPVMSGGRLMVVSSVGDINFLSPQDGQILEADQYDQSFIFAPVLVKDKALLLSATGKLTALV
ncbi:MAG: hypothetical protein C0582_01400 [Alphaproteobacteria bacterium]|nr:MAG: hypothetical protein C0582_01400 [Alphaproteobacteria bacterium]